MARNLHETPLDSSLDKVQAQATLRRLGDRVGEGGHCHRSIFTDNANKWSVVVVVAIVVVESTSNGVNKK